MDYDYTNLTDGISAMAAGIATGFSFWLAGKAVHLAMAALRSIGMGE